MASVQYYKIKHSSGRILGPLDLERVRALIAKKQLNGTEIARLHPQGEWTDVAKIPEIAELLLQQASSSGKFQSRDSSGTRANSYQPILGNPNAQGQARNYADAMAPTELLQPSEKLPTNDVLPGAEHAFTAPLVLNPGAAEPTLVLKPPARVPAEVEEPTVIGELIRPADFDAESNRTSVDVPRDPEDPTLLTSQLPVMPERSEESRLMDPNLPVALESLHGYDVGSKKLSQEKTVLFEMDPAKRKKKMRIPERKELIKVIVVALLLGGFGYEYVFDDAAEENAELTKIELIRPKLPNTVQGKGDPQKSQKLYADAMKYYVVDNVAGYKSAASLLLQSAGADISNVKALAMLASCYINLIDTSNKDENYFSVITRLIDLSRAKSVDLPETVIADAEFYVTVHRSDAALNRVIEYTKTHENFGLEMFFYLSYAFYSRGDAQNAAKYIAQYPDNKVFTPRVFYLKGLIAEKLGDTEAALIEYRKALKFSVSHTHSRLRIAQIYYQSGKLKEAGKDLEYLVQHPQYQAPKELGLSNYLYGQYNQLFHRDSIALGAFERATKLDHDNHDYLLEVYTLRAKTGDAVKHAQTEAKMYYYLGEGEKRIKEAKYQEALAQFLEARQVNLSSTLPLVRAGDMFVSLNDLVNARMNYQMAAEKAPNNIEIWSKYMDVLIQSYEWEDAQKAMEKFRNLPVSQSAIDKAAGDMFAKQGRHLEAQMFYKKAMARDSIDTDVYISYAKSLMGSHNFKDAPFFFALALRFDPTNTEALIGTAKSVAAAESIDAGITFLQDEMQKEGGTRAELIAAIGEFQIQKGEWEIAQQYVDQAIAANPDYALPWKLQAQIHMNKEGMDKKALDKALDAYRSYSDRNISDPSGYLERYRVFVKKSEFEKASDELGKIYSLYPKYPNLHYYKGALYGVMGNHKAAVEEYTLELKNNPNGVTTMVSLGKELIEVGDARQALTHLSKAMQMAPTSAEPKSQAAYANFILKNYQGAIALYNAALVYDKGNPQIYKRLGMVYRDMGDMPGAKNAFKKYLEMEPDAQDRAEFERFL